MLIPYLKPTHSYPKQLKVIVPVFCFCLGLVLHYYANSIILSSSVISIYCIAFIKCLAQQQKHIGLCKFLSTCIWILFSAFFISFLTIDINSDIGTMSSIYIWGNIAIYFLLSLIIYILTRYITIAVSLMVITSYSFACANYFVNLFRGTPIIPGDFLSIGTAMTVLKNYTYEIPSKMAFGIWSIILFIFISYYLFGMKRSSYRFVLLWSFPSAILLSLILGGTFWAPELDPWNLNSNIKQYGIAMNFVSNLRNMHISEPYSYSQKDSNKYISTFVESSETDPGFCPNIIAIMNESFSDISVFLTK